MTTGLRTILTASLLAGACGLGMPAAAQDLKRPEEQLAAIYALRMQLEVEQKVFDDDLQRYADVAPAREETRARVRRMAEDLDAMVLGKSEATVEELEKREADLARAERDLDLLVAEARDLRRRIRTGADRIALLQDRLARLTKSLPSDTESLTGVWDITYLPSNDKGVFTLRQSGTLLVGEYVLEGGWRGSLQGTVVSGKVLLHRIDSKLGQSQDLEGNLSPEGRTLRGHWQNLVLSGGTITTGNWVAQKRERTDS
ncbi:MAG TPA: hypothetical protein VJV75_10330 [Candidatus Polarisedimenticolia bacterium]|nr:hypothetical protein [Candidatus Polarisedimenticolia bacterium]